MGPLTTHGHLKCEKESQLDTDFYKVRVSFHHCSLHSHFINSVQTKIRRPIPNLDIHNKENRQNFWFSEDIIMFCQLRHVVCLFCSLLLFLLPCLTAIWKWRHPFLSAKMLIQHHCLVSSGSRRSHQQQLVTAELPVFWALFSTRPFCQRTSHWPEWQRWGLLATPMCFKCVTDGKVEVGWGLPQPGQPAACSPVSEGRHSHAQRTPRSPRKPCQEKGADWQFMSKNRDEILEKICAFPRKSGVKCMLYYGKQIHQLISCVSEVWFRDTGGITSCLQIKIICFLFYVELLDSIACSSAPY